MPDQQPHKLEDPDEYRMSLGDHLEELRKRIILALLGFFAAGIVCAVYGQQVIQIFCRPLVGVLLEQRISPQLYFTSAGDPFTVYLKITLIAAAVIASPWIIWQLWLFVAAGLYPKERRAIWRYAPLSLGLLVAGLLFCFFIVLPLSLRFFIVFGEDFKLDVPRYATTAPTTAPARMTLPAWTEDPEGPLPYQMWVNTSQHRVKIAIPDAQGTLQKMVLNYGPESLVSPIITLPDYIDMVLLWLLIFGLAFQLPLVTMALAKLGLVETADLAKFRKYVYVGLAILSSMLMPDVFSGTLALMIPLCVLYELGIFLAKWTGKGEAKLTK